MAGNHVKRTRAHRAPSVSQTHPTSRSHDQFEMATRASRREAAQAGKIIDTDDGSIKIRQYGAGACLCQNVGVTRNLLISQHE